MTVRRYAQEARAATKDLCHLRPAIYLAPQVGARLDQREVLLASLPWQQEYGATTGVTKKTG